MIISMLQFVFLRDIFSSMICDNIVQLYFRTMIKYYKVKKMDWRGLGFISNTSYLFTYTSRC